MHKRNMPIPVTLPPDLAAQVAEAAEATGLKPAEIARQCLRRGLTRLVADLRPADLEPPTIPGSPA